MAERGGRFARALQLKSRRSGKFSYLVRAVAVTNESNSLVLFKISIEPERPHLRPPFRGVAS